MLTVLAGVALICFSLYVFSLRLQMRSQQLVRREHRGLLCLELRRCAQLRAHDDGSGGRSFPAPIESRTRAWLLFEVPLWIRRESIGLPCGTEARFDQLAAMDFDHHFTTDFQAHSGVWQASRSHMLA